MTIGGSIGLIVVGAILAFAVTYDIAGIDINVIGFILMLGGLIGLLVGLIMAQRARTTRTTRVVDDRDVY
ncbi:DUF6458 family protein [Nitriliruptor alkaliphilus]|uniref:DUF6458 family protein n=1 Tax=Nitriliruptor alkaliphilus TaxID=427918 RepID=UPI000697A455|nr:DUF6458 family protein [Nitriliruptor alkaliphilus]